MVYTFFSIYLFYNILSGIHFFLNIINKSFLKIPCFSKFHTNFKWCLLVPLVSNNLIFVCLFEPSHSFRSLMSNRFSNCFTYLKKIVYLVHYNPCQIVCLLVAPISKILSIYATHVKYIVYLLLRCQQIWLKLKQK